jgi:NAD(P)H-flavin reductase
MPRLATIEEVRDEVGGSRPIRTFKMVFQNEEEKKDFDFKPGQFVMVGLFGEGESPFAISSSPTQKGYIEVSVMRHGKNTSALHQTEVGDTVGVRGPLGNHFDVDSWQGKNILFIGGGIGQAPIRSVMNYVLDNRDKYGSLSLIYGARTTEDLCFKEEIFALKDGKEMDVHLSIDVAEDGWDHFVGFVPDNLLRVSPSPKNSIAITCGPPIMIRFVILNLLKLGFTVDQIYTTLEMRMKCGVGNCGRCNIGHKYVCTDGPVFSAQELNEMRGER